MKITIIQGAFYPVPSLNGTSVEKFWYELGADLAARGHTVVHISRRHHLLPNSETCRGVTYRRIFGFDSPKYYAIRILLDFIYSCFAFISLPKADVVISNTFWFPILATFRFKDRGKLIVSVDRMPRGQYKFYRAASAFRVPSLAVLNAIKAESPSAGRKCLLIPNPLPYIPATQPQLSVKSNCILYVGRIHPEKGIEVLLQAFQKSCQLGLQNWVLRIVGPSNFSSGGAGDEFLQQLKLQYPSKLFPIDWVGPIYDNMQLQKEFINSSIFVYPSKLGAGEALPVAPLEAMSQGAVPIVSDLECFKDYIRPGENGLIFSHNGSSIDNLSNAILLLVHDKMLRERLAIEACKVRESHSSSKIARLLESEFCKLIRPLNMQ